MNLKNIKTKKEAKERLDDLKKRQEKSFNKYRALNIIQIERFIKE